MEDTRGKFVRRPWAWWAAVLLSLYLVSCFLSLAFAQANAIESLQRFFAEVDRYTADFEQVVLDELGEPIQQSEGRLWIARPNKFRWNYEAPYAQQIVSDGERLWVYDEDLKQVTVRRLEGGLLDTPAVLLAGKGRLEDQFYIEDLGVEDGFAWVQLTPKRKESGFEWVRIGFDDGRLRKIEIEDSLGQTTRYILRNAVENPKIPDSRFQFTPPPGVDVVGAQPPER